MRDGQLVLAHGGLYGGRHLTQAVADATHVDLQAARMLRLKHSRMHSTAVSEHDQHVLYVAPRKNNVDAMQREHEILELAARPVTDSLCRALQQVKEQFESSPSGSIIERLLFVGGESRDRRFCETIARRQPQPAWAVAIGLSLGPAEVKPAESDDDLRDPIAPIRA